MKARMDAWVKGGSKGLFDPKAKAGKPGYFALPVTARPTAATRAASVVPAVRVAVPKPVAPVVQPQAAPVDDGKDVLAILHGCGLHGFKRSERTELQPLLRKAETKAADHGAPGAAGSRREMQPAGSDDGSDVLAMIHATGLAGFTRNPGR